MNDKYKVSSQETILDELPKVDQDCDCIIIEDIDRIFIDAEIARVKEDSRSINKCSIIDVDNEKVFHTYKKGKPRVASLSVGILGGISFSFNCKKAEYNSTIDKWLNDIKASDNKYIFIYNIRKEKNLEIVQGFITRFMKEYKVMYPYKKLVILDADFGSEIRKQVEWANFVSLDCSVVNDKMREAFRSGVSESIESAQKYLFHWLKFKKVLSDISFMEYIAKRTGEIDNVACTIFFQTTNFPYKIEDNPKDIVNDPKIFSEVINTIKLIRIYDPFNLSLIGELYNLLGRKDIANELTICEEIVKGKEFGKESLEENYKTKEMICEVKIRNLRDKYKDRSRSSEYDMELYSLYNEFVEECNSTNYVAIRLGFILFPQLYNRAELEKSREVYVKLKRMIDKIEGEISKMYLDTMKFTLTYLSTASLSLNEVMAQGKDYFNQESINDILLDTNNLEIDLGYSNILGYILTAFGESYLDVCDCIYKTFLIKYKETNSLEIDRRILNNLAIYELIKKKRKVFTKKMREYVDERIVRVQSKKGTDNELGDIIILLNNLVFVDYSKYYDVYQRAAKMKSEEFYDYYLNAAQLFFEQNVNQVEIPIVCREIKREIELRTKKRNDGIKDHHSYLFIDYQFWGIV